jgi:hypothetical protein
MFCFLAVTVTGKRSALLRGKVRTHSKYFQTMNGGGGTEWNTILTTSIAFQRLSTNEYKTQIDCCSVQPPYKKEIEETTCS